MTRLLHPFLHILMRTSPQRLGITQPRVKSQLERSPSDKEEMVGSGGRVILCTWVRPRSIFRPSSSRPSLYNSVMRYNHQDHADERAPSTAEEFKRLEEEMKKADQGVASQTVDKAYDGAAEAVAGDSNLESVKKRYKEHEEGADYRRTGNDGPGERPPNTFTGS